MQISTSFSSSNSSNSLDSHEINRVDDIIGQPSTVHVSSPTSVHYGPFVQSSPQKAAQTPRSLDSRKPADATLLSLTDDELPQNLMGFLTKKGRITRFGRQRYFTLEQDILSCRHTQYSSPTWRIFVSESSIHKSGNEITLRLPSRPDITMVADDSVSAYQWYQALQRARRRGRARFSGHGTFTGGT